MKVSKKWIEQFVDISDIDVDILINKLTMSGFEVESTTKISENNNVVAGVVQDVKPLKDSDHLKVCTVFDGKTTYNAVCGASNVSNGLIVPFARPGAKLSGNLEIKNVEIKGVESEGMICSAEELGIEEKSLGVMTLIGELKPGDDINNILELPDYVLDVSITPNRGDCLSIRGLSREIAAIFDRPFKDISFELIENSIEVIDKFCDVEIIDKAGCPLYTGRIVRNIKIISAPTFMQVRLKKTGINCINNVVDVSNYVLIETGQPLHTFDLSNIKEKIVVRRAKNGETIKLLDGRTIKLDSDLLVISDIEKPVAVAGIMGGEHSGVSDLTKDIFLESAFFSPFIIRKGAKKLNLTTDASYRFERGIDIGETENMANYAAFLLQKYASGEVVRGVVKRSAAYERKKRNVSFSFNKINELLGYSVNQDMQKSILKRLNIYVKGNGNDYTAEIPTYRRDIELEADLAEEIARIYGYENIPEIKVKINADSKPPAFDFTQVKTIKLALKSLGFIETINYSFIDEKYLQQFYMNNNFIKLKNPISEELNVLRGSIFPSLIKNILSNIRVGQLDLRLFEIAKVFGKLKDDGLPCEETHLSLAITDDFWPLNWLQKGTNNNFYIIKGVIDNIMSSLKLCYSMKRSSLAFLHPGKSADMIINNEVAGFVGELHPSFYELLDISTKIYIAELSLDKVLEVAKVNSIKYKKYSIYPYVNKDLSLIFDEGIPVSTIYDLIYSVSPLIKNVYLYDIYKGKNIEQGKRSLTFRIVFSSFSRTLTDKETNEILDTIIEKCKKEFNASLR